MINVASFVEQCYSKLPYQLQREPWKVTNHGRDVLKTEDQLNAYLAAYGEIHIVKCRAALQNFPFDDLRSNSYEIFDWGCGQGIATLTLLEMLQERKLLYSLKRITLIEPSQEALKRATSWVKESVGPGVDVVSINEYIPSSDNQKLDSVCCYSDKSINLFSNILDIQNLSLSWLANKTSSLARQNYMICVGPKYTGNTRIADFCGYFAPKEYFSQISTYPYAYTTKTHHAFGCETKCFVHNRSNELNIKYQEKASNVSYSDDYDYAAECMRGIINDDIINLFNRLRKECGLDYDIFLRPSINMDVPDIVVANSDKGIYLINVCTDLSKLREEYSKIEAIKKNIYDLHLKSIKIDSISSHRLFYVIKTALYFPYENIDGYKSEILRLQEEEDNNCKNKKGEFVKEPKDVNNDFRNLIKIFSTDNLRVKLEENRSYKLKNEYYDEFIKIIVGHWHSYKEGDLNFHLSERQLSIVRSRNKQIRVKGVAGSGKTQVVANRAVEQQLRTGDKVLIITFNISLIQYIKMRINQVPADFCTNKFIIMNYHQFFKSMSKRYLPEQKISIESFNEKGYFERCKNKIEKYKSIVIDEVQDFKEEWLSILFTYFLADGGSISVFGDGEQNIYDRELEKDTKMPTIPGFTGRWNEMNERISMRIQNKDIAVLSAKFAKKFISKDYAQMSINNEFQFENYFIKYWNVGSNVSSETLAKNIIWILSTYNIAVKDTAVLGLSINLLKNVEFDYRRLVGRKSMINFETKEEFIDILKQDSDDDKMLQRDIYAIRRTAKTHFTTDTSEIKFSTIHSFKGWESKSIILLLQEEKEEEQLLSDSYQVKEHTNNAALVYTALTRARCNLFILNLGNEEYEEFFKENINMN